MTSDEREAFILIMAARKTLYKLLSDLWMSEPEEKDIEQLYDRPIRVTLELLTPEESGYDLPARLAALQVKAEEYTDIYLDGLKKQYHRLLQTDLAPFALYYLPLEDEEKEEELLMVRSTYERYGAMHAKPSLEADGYLAMELGFMARACGLAQQAMELGIDRRAEQLLEEQEWFLDDHLLSWVPLWRRELQRGEEVDFYQNLAALTEEFLRCDSLSMADLLEAL